MTDNEIIKALKCCGNYNDCDKCDFEPKDNKKKTIGCCLETMKNALDLITRQQTEIKSLQKEVSVARDAYISIQDRYEHTKSEAYKEFAERLKKDIFNTEYHIDRYYRRTIDKLTKEMAGENNE